MFLDRSVITNFLPPVNLMWHSFKLMVKIEDPYRNHNKMAKREIARQKIYNANRS